MRENPYPRERLGKFIEQIRGVTYIPSDLRREIDENSVVLLRANNIDHGRINHDDIQIVSREKVSKAQFICTGDILMCASSGSLEHIGKTALCPSAVEGETFGAFCKVIRAKADLEAKYISAYFDTDEYRDIIMHLANGANINNLKNEHIDELQIPVPDIAGQASFIDYIEQIDKLRFDTEEKIKELKKEKEQLIDKYFR